MKKVHLSHIRSRVIIFITSIIILCILVAFFDTARAERERLPVKTLTIGEVAITAEVAATPSTRAQGLMYRKSLPPHTGMLFVFDYPRKVSFWMKNTLMDLDIAYIDGSGAITQILTMKRGTTEKHSSRGPVRWALEMESGYFATQKISPGMIVVGL